MVTGHTKKSARSFLTGRGFPVILFALVAVLTTIDIALDLAAGTTVLHVLIEGLLVLVAVLGAVYFWGRLRSSERHEDELMRDLKRVREQTARWQQEQLELVTNLRKAIRTQFQQWEFSPTEQEIAFYLLKGLSMKDIAGLRGTTDRSVKQQAYVLYHKAGLAGRAELSAFFLGELLQPNGPEQALH